MLNLAISDTLLNTKSEKTLKRIRRKIDRDLSKMPGVVLHFKAQPKSKKQSTVQTFLQVSDEIFHHHEFDVKCWESALEQTVDHAIWFVRRDLPYIRQEKEENRFQVR